MDDSNKKEDKSDFVSDEFVTYGPALPVALQVNSNKNEESDSDSDNVYGPSLPKHMKKSSNLNQNVDESQINNKTEVSNIYGPSLPPTFERTKNHSIENCETVIENENIVDSDEESNIGPQPIDSQLHSKTEYELELRALQLKMKSDTSSQEKKKRESWMLELPNVSVSKTLMSRQFRSNPGPDLSDRSTWTNIQGHQNNEKDMDKVKSELKMKTELLDLERREKEQEKIVKKLKKKSKRNQSLLDIHRENLNKKKKNSEPVERRPFDRDIDIKAYTLNPQKKAQIIKNASELNNKFASGKIKYL